jgi:hypothetical protein
VRELEFLDEALQPVRLFDGVQVLALDVLDEADAERGLIRHFTHHCGNALEAREARRAPAPLAGEDLVIAAVYGAHHDRLDHAAGADRVGKLRERGFIHARARLVLAGAQGCDRDLLQRLLVGSRLAVIAAQQRIEAAAQTLVTCGHAASATLMPLRASSSRAN